jgi:hypothetical protein
MSTPCCSQSFVFITKGISKKTRIIVASSQHLVHIAPVASKSKVGQSWHGIAIAEWAPCISASMHLYRIQRSPSAAGLSRLSIMLAFSLSGNLSLLRPAFKKFGSTWVYRRYQSSISTSVSFSLWLFHPNGDILKAYMGMLFYTCKLPTTG